MLNNHAHRSHLKSLMTFVLLATLFSSVSHSVAQAPRNRNQPAIVFAVTEDDGNFNLDAVVAINGKVLRAPFSEDKEAQQDAFAKQYFAAGKNYRLLFGGGEVGTVTLKGWSRGCNSVHAEASGSTPVRLTGQVKGLATSSDSIGKQAAARRAPTAAEREAVMALVKRIYTQHGVSPALYRGLGVTNLTATDLDGDGNYEMIGSFTLATKAKFERDLFLIAKPQGATMRAEFANFQAYQPPAEGFLSSIDFVDQLDLDGDGMGEVFAIQGGFDAYGYLIYKKRAGRWLKVYSGMGDAC
ncbi:MAG: hypothetical protein QOE77_1188 [Blastocatellia bacterium]|jgi:hypothetical protein|nr:hypothetical protein [Blastocatellia bacterium]